VFETLYKGKLSKGSCNHTGLQGRRGMNHGLLRPEVTQRWVSWRTCYFGSYYVEYEREL